MEMVPLVANKLTKVMNNIADWLTSSYTECK